MKISIKEYYKIYLSDKLRHAPAPLFLCHTKVVSPFDSRRYKPLKGYYIFMYTISGCGLFGDDGTVRELPPGCAILYKFPSDRYHFSLENGMDTWSSVYLEFDAGDMEDTMAELIDAHGAVYELMPESNIIKRMLDYRKENHGGACSPTMEGPDMISRGSIRMTGMEGAQMVYAILAVLRSCAKTSSRRQRTLVNAFCDYVNGRVTMPLNIGQIAKTLAVSRVHLTRVFTTQMGMSPHRYIITSKIRLACQLLTMKEMKNKTIATQIGMVSEFYFYRMFKQATGMTPGGFRTSPRQEEIIRSL